ncbi:hypothetical protein LEMLEM_LOCUS2828 [Lemmus lemmus]
MEASLTAVLMIADSSITVKETLEAFVAPPPPEKEAAQTGSY